MRPKDNGELKTCTATKFYQGGFMHACRKRRGHTRLKDVQARQHECGCGERWSA